MTIGETYEPAMKATTLEEAAFYFETLVERNLEFCEDRAAAERVVRQNLGYFAGYYDNATRERVERLYNCVHPFFGSIEKNGPPTPEQAFKMGQDFGSGKNRTEVEQPTGAQVKKIRAIDV